MVSVTDEYQDVSLTLIGDEGISLETTEHGVNEGIIRSFTVKNWKSIDGHQTRTNHPFLLRSIGISVRRCQDFSNQWGLS